jgi:ssDNA-binding Zn-finger/Zn-ribbon topoisomerase 1
MRVDVEPVDLFLELMRQNRPCPRCGSARVTVRRELRAGGGALVRAECSDCKRIAERVEPPDR